MCKIFANSKLDSADKDPDIWINNLEVFRQRLDDIRPVGRMSDMKFMIHVLNNLPEKYGVVLDSLASFNWKRQINNGISQREAKLKI